MGGGLTLGDDVLDSFGVTGAFVVDGRDRTVFAFIGGRPAATDLLARSGGDLGRLIATARATAAGGWSRRAASRPSTGARSWSPPRPSRRRGRRSRDRRRRSPTRRACWSSPAPSTRWPCAGWRRTIISRASSSPPEQRPTAPPCCPCRRYGPGAGGAPTASAVLGDLVAVVPQQAGRHHRAG